MLFLCLGLLFGTTAQAQKKARKDLFKVRAPKIKYVKPDTTVLIKNEDFPTDGKANRGTFSPIKKLSIVSEDTSNLDLGEQSIVEMSEEVQMEDSVWVKIASYYAIWDTRNINPYRKDGRQIKDTIAIKLYDKEHSYKMPLVKTPVTSDFGFRGYRWHYGTDLDLDTGDSVKAAFDGVIRISKWDGGGYGNYLVVRHVNGLETLYGHLSKPVAKVGQMVKAGELIGWGGSTGRSSGPHLHYEVRYEGNPIDPEEIYDFPDYLLKGENFQITSALFNYYNRTSKKKSSYGAKSARRAVYHKVRSGEVLGTIARKYGVSVAQIAKLNRISTRTTLKIGRNLRVK
ncbi:peptidoglycan DD-metalloendopeptidase family protein [Rufibacter sp. LB8]|uniref:peptidoglycan DD-metalloendopeptidase family protein n=1 Tax=Rufibacter sp. LB8 TaxID=2777781 RepID=UPI001CEF7830|nr:peptidoglycan DD-metalloendopeptidase family protein [Rufibacter sp. LB8]